jgi:hypothetical protein
MRGRMDRDFMESKQQLSATKMNLSRKEGMGNTAGE